MFFSGSTQAAPLQECSYGEPTADGRRFGDNLFASFGGLDDGSALESLTAVFPGGLPFYGSYADAWVNVNGNLTFHAAFGSFTPSAIPGLSQPTIAPFFADVDLRGGLGAVYRCAEEGDDPRITFTWFQVGYYNSNHDLQNSFQVTLSNAADECSGAFNVELRYEQLQWTTGDASGGSGGLGGTPAAAGLDSGTGSVDPADAVALPGSHTSDVLDLVTESNVDDPGVFRFRLAGALPECGNGVVDVCEECDDNNVINEDDCTNLCLRNVCGDGFQDRSGDDFEECDDGNTVAGDDCFECRLVGPGDPSEPNNSMEEATELVLGETYPMSFLPRGDRDFFTVTPSTDSILEVEFTNLPDGLEPHILWIGDDGTVLRTASRVLWAPADRPVFLALRSAARSWEERAWSALFEFRVVASSAADPFEPNDTLDDATELVAGREIVVELAGQDVDYTVLVDPPVGALRATLIVESPTDAEVSFTWVSQSDVAIGQTAPNPAGTDARLPEAERSGRAVVRVGPLQPDLRESDAPVGYRLRLDAAAPDPDQPPSRYPRLPPSLHVVESFEEWR